MKTRQKDEFGIGAMGLDDLALFPSVEDLPELPQGCSGAVLAELEAYQVEHPRMRNVSRALGDRLRQLVLECRCDVLEIGTSNGMSAIWMGIAAQSIGRRVVTFEKHSWKAQLARDSIQRAGLTETVCVIEGEAEHLLESVSPAFGLLFLDVWPPDYPAIVDAALPLLSGGALLVADNILSHRDRFGQRFPTGPGAVAFLEYVRGSRFTGQHLLGVGEGVFMAEVRQ